MKGYRDNGGGGGGFGARSKTVYDDVFGGPPKFGATTLPPRLEDYTEIFQGFHASRGSSIPVLDLPPPCDDSDDVWFDVQSSKLDYSEVFGGFNGLDFAVSYEELFKSSKVGDDDSSDDVWTPAQSESLSDESDPYASLETNQHMSTENPDQLFGVKLENERILEADKDVLNGIQINLDSHTLPIKKENEKLFSLANDNNCASNEFNGVTEEKHLKQSFSQPLDNVYNKETYENQKANPVNNKPPLSVFDLSLKTQPSHLPPPSRPPPALESKKGDGGSFNSKLKTSKSYAFERVTGDRSPPYFDVEIDASSSAAIDAAAMKDAVEQAQAKLRSAKESMDRKKESLQKRSKMRMENNNVADVSKERVNEDYENLIEIQLKDNDIETEKVVSETQIEHDNGRKEDDESAFEWENYDFGLGEKVNEKVIKESEQVGPPEVMIIQSEEEDDDHEEEEMEKIIEDNFKWDESDNNHNISETDSEQDVNEKEQTLNPDEKVLEKDKISEKTESIHENDCNLEEDKTFQKDPETAESKENDGVENLEETESSTKESSEASDVDSNEILEPSRNIQQDTHSEKDEDTPETSYDHNEKVEETVGQIHQVAEESQGIKVEIKTADSINTNSSKESVEKTPVENDKIPSKVEDKTPEIRKENSFNESSVKTPMENDTIASKVAGRNKEKEKEEKMERERDIEKERLRKIEEERERQIERAKDRMAVDRATLEARERAFSETKERAAVDRATAEFRQRALAEARERLEKACADARERSLAEKAMEGRIRVEKATAEARERAERSVDDKFSASRSNAAMRQTSLPSDLGDSHFQRVGSFSGLRYPQNGGEDESPQRCKARFERHQRTADRAAKALAEKNMRDLLAQKEQAERNRLAEGIDAEVKRWCSGKQGNLRALLSTLQYILGPESGWQPVPLTEVITTAAVKKAYRKATLCVHPDKLQQRGATIHQKYICEKVFDLLKEAWNKFNSEER